MNIGGKYNWKHAERDQLIYLGKKGSWHQFKKIGDPREVWCEVLDEDLHMIEETKDIPMPRWPHRYKYLSSMGYVVWRDVFEGDMRCALDDAVKEHKVAVFVCESEASNYCDYRNAMTMKHGTDDVSKIAGKETDELQAR